MSLDVVAGMVSACKNIIAELNRGDKLDGDNYDIWYRKVQYVLEEQENSIARITLLSCMQDDLMCEFEEYETAKGMWEALKEKFGATSATKLRRLNQRFGVKSIGQSFVILSLYVDDILLAGNDMEFLITIKQWLSSHFEMKDMGEAEYILGVKIHRDRSRKLLVLSQESSSLMYAMMCTRPDICYAVGLVSRYQSNPGEKHWMAVKRILR
ncbi:unnamed protein product [Microthlaspi erraticum]|uniref:Reverse transcriptase Ty1/copia-type domain-containing protein n=1 Tax=Microthlaspi erraticum TaxID=1685480 RepID=A0A6D2LEZ3_9BRAS|nr:unnamed protein product [Microthlaspi erraticum]